MRAASSNISAGTKQAHSRNQQLHSYCVAAFRIVVFALVLLLEWAARLSRRFRV